MGAFDCLSCISQPDYSIRSGQTFLPPWDDLTPGLFCSHNSKKPALLSWQSGEDTSTAAMETGWVHGTAGHKNLLEKTTRANGW